MRTNIVLNDDLVEEATRLTGIKTRKELVNYALESLVQRRRAEQARATYDSRLTDLQARCARLVFRESSHDLIRADRDRK